MISGIMSVHNFLNNFQVKNKVVFKPTAEAQVVTLAPSSDLKADPLQMSFSETPRSSHWSERAMVEHHSSVSSCS